MRLRFLWPVKAQSERSVSSAVEDIVVEVPDVTTPPLPVSIGAIDGYLLLSGMISAGTRCSPLLLSNSQVTGM